MTDDASPEQIKAVMAYADSVTLKNPDLDVLLEEFKDRYSALAMALQDILKKAYAQGRVMLPELEAYGNETVAVFSDYGGETTGNYYTYSFLVCAYGMTEPFEQKM